MRRKAEGTGRDGTVHSDVGARVAKDAEFSIPAIQSPPAGKSVGRRDHFNAALHALNAPIELRLPLVLQSPLNLVLAFVKPDQFHQIEIQRETVLTMMMLALNPPPPGTDPESRQS